MSVHDRLGYEGQRRYRERRRRREHVDGYSRAWWQWFYNYNYRPSYDSTDEWVDYDNEAEDYYSWKPQRYSGYLLKHIFMNRLTLIFGMRVDVDFG